MNVRKTFPCVFSISPEGPEQKLCLRVCLVTQSCLTLCNPMNCSPPGSSVCGILQARILEWVAISSSRGSSQLRDQTQVPCTAGRFFLSEPPGKPTLDLKVAPSRFQEPLQGSSPLGLGPSHYLESYLPWSSREPQKGWRELSPFLSVT